MDILIAVPTFENITPETFRSIYYAASFATLPFGDKIGFDFVKGYDCARARNEICKKAIDGKYDIILMVDSDTTIPDHTIRRLLEGLDEGFDLMLGVVPRKNTTTKQTELFSFNLTDRYSDANRYGIQEIEQLAYLGYDQVHIKGGGFGCAMFKTDILKRLEYPWFKYVLYPNDQVLSEDLYFCESLNEAGMKVGMDPRVRCMHLVRKFQYE